MAIAVELPALSPTMKEGKITRWLKKEGDKVTSGTAIAEVETDKSNLEIEAYDDGVLLKILVPEGSAAPVGSTIAYIGKAGEKVEDAPAPKAESKKDEPKKEEPKKEEAKAPPAPPAPPAAPMRAVAFVRRRSRSASRQRRASISPRSPAPARAAAS